MDYPAASYVVSKTPRNEASFGEYHPESFKLHALSRMTLRATTKHENILYSNPVFSYKGYCILWLLCYKRRNPQPVASRNAFFRRLAILRSMMAPKPWTIVSSHRDKSYRVFNLRTDHACSPRTNRTNDFFIITNSLVIVAFYRFYMEYMQGFR